MKADAKDPEAWYQLGLARKSQGESRRDRLFPEGIALKPDFEKAHYNLGIALRLAGRKEAAEGTDGRQPV